MDAESELRLSYYQKVADIDARHDVALVKHTEDGRFYVRKRLVNYDISVLETLKSGMFPGIPKIVEIFYSTTDDDINASGMKGIEGFNDLAVLDGDYGQVKSGEIIVIEEYISGRTLAEMISDGKLFSTEEIASIIVKLCGILEPLHCNKPPIIHRDIKPSNVMMTSEGAIYLIDFDAGKIYSEGKSRDTVLMGTKGYAAPEQYGFGQSDERTDIYLLGSLAEELLGLCEETKSKEDSTQEESSEGTDEIADNNDDLLEIIRKCKALDPKDRYQSVSELSVAVDCCLLADKEHGSGGTDKYTYGCNDIGTENDRIYDQPEEQYNEYLNGRNPDQYKESWLLPGFRLHDPKRIIGALIWYAFIIYYAVMPLTKDDIAEHFGRADHVLAAIAMFVCTLLVGNYRGIADHFPLISSGVLWKRIAGYVLFCFLIFVVAAALALLINPR